MKGKAYLVGAGPGRPDLITVRGMNLIRRAEAIIYDRLISPELLEEASPGVEKLFVGKTPGHHSTPQDRINQLLVQKVREGKQVVRLKGGDPFVFGRGGEEALALSKAGLPFEIVPGISSAIAAPAYAGIPVTHRGVSTAFAVVTGHETLDKLEHNTYWSALAEIPTVVVLMGVRNIRHISCMLIEAGRDPQTPAAAIRQGTTEHQDIVTASLATIADAIEARSITPPAVIVIGDVVSLAGPLDWCCPEELNSHLVSLFEQNQSQFAMKGNNMKKRAIVLIGHGSRAPEAVSEFNLFARALAEHIEQPVGTGFLELSQPSMHDALVQAAQQAGEGGEVLAVPMFLGSAYHMKAEVSHIIHHVSEHYPRTDFKYSTALGFHVRLAEILKVRVDAAIAAAPDALPPEETTVLVVGGGSSDSDSNSSVSKVARVLYEIGNYAGVEVAYQRVTHPTTAEGLERVYKLGATQVVVVPYLLFTGIVHQKLVAAADEAAGELGIKIIHAQYLGPKHPFLVEVAAQRLLEAADGMSELLRHKTIEGIPLVIDGNGGHHHHHDHNGHKHEHHSHDHDLEHHHH